MTKAEKKMVLEVRLNNLMSRGKQHDCPGVMKKLQRQIRNLEK